MYNIITFCSSHNHYINILNKTLPTWLRHSNLDKVFVYTDYQYQDQLMINSDRVIINKFCKYSNNFGVNCCRKAECVLHHINNNDRIDNFILLDTDCAMLHDLDHVFSSNKFDIGISIYSFLKAHQALNNISSGVLFYKHNDRSRQIILDWNSLQKQPNITPALDQNALTKAIQKNKNQADIMLLPYQRYNMHPLTNYMDYVSAVLKNKADIDILHLSKRTIDNKQILKEIFNEN